VLVVNWNDQEYQSLVLNFINIGIAGDAYFKCQVTDMYTGELLGVYKESYFISDIAPHDNVALKIKCTPWLLESSETTFLL
jgi:hypothetical protein